MRTHENHRKREDQLGHVLILARYDAMIVI